MGNETQTDSLREWNRLSRENAENALVSSMFEAGLKASEPIENFSTWLLVGTAAVASFFVTSADRLLPLLGQKGFLICGAFLCFSGIFGLVSRLYALHCKVQIETGTAVRKTFAEQLAKHGEVEAKINESANAHGITLETGVRMERILAKFLAPLPRWVAWLVYRALKRNEGNPQMGYLAAIRGVQRQGVFAVLQAMSFLGFVIAGIVAAATI
ncbi:hypothetical protein M5J07_27765 [Achromobacter mucicolens]|uniref:hypothetical protein n=1 Tax=Achromobacter mucicolens TaxID=1389922 RepID=UPI0020A5F67F|nr:hypothetical protein [Achromobacter mucicolens]MCP2518752.1 hypothetical protein [Achromobacter mucicolens]